MNDLGYSQLLNLIWSLKLVLMRVRNHWELFVRYFHHLGQGFHCISFLESIFSNTKGIWSHLDHTIIFVDFISYLIYDVLDIPWPEIRKSKLKHDHPSTRCLWCLKLKVHMYNHEMNQPNWQLDIITIKGFIWINLVNFFSKEHPLFILSFSTPMATRSTILIICGRSNSAILSDNSMPFSNIPWIWVFRTYV